MLQPLHQFVDNLLTLTDICGPTLSKVRNNVLDVLRWVVNCYPEFEPIPCQLCRDVLLDWRHVAPISNHDLIAGDVLVRIIQLLRPLHKVLQDTTNLHKLVVSR
jgi:hypothetical protein